MINSIASDSSNWKQNDKVYQLARTSSMRRFSINLTLGLLRLFNFEFWILQIFALFLSFSVWISNSLILRFFHCRHIPRAFSHTLSLCFLEFFFSCSLTLSNLRVNPRPSLDTTIFSFFTFRNEIFQSRHSRCTSQMLFNSRFCRAVFASKRQVVETKE